MKIGILLPGHVPDAMREKHGDFDAMFERLMEGHGFTFQSWDVEGGDIPAQPTDADGWIITGSRHGSYEPHPWIAPLEDFIRRCYSHPVPMVGVCFGHQIIAQALGGRVEKHGAGWGLGALDYDTGDRVIAVHQDQVIEPPEGAKTLASSALCKHAILAYGDRALTIQPHPEFDERFLEDILKVRFQHVEGAPVDAARATIGCGALTSPRFGETFAEFFKRPR